MPNNIELREINKLIKEKFYIPTYQRGYRWDKQQVVDLLEDIYDFIGKGNIQSGEFYCLQPIVVKKRTDDRYDVIDGQQRLTTILIILKYLEKRNTFSIEYASREGSSDFLKSIAYYAENDGETNYKNIDYFFMIGAFKYVKEWFIQKVDENEEYSLEDEFSTHLLKYCKVIWYEVDDEANAESIFTRLNIGKIPLTNAELIKALFLRKSNFKDNFDSSYLRQLEIASEWDYIENTLRNDKVWYFINPTNFHAPTRIEFLFDTIAGKTNHSETNYTFLDYSTRIEKEGILSLWKEVKDYFRIIMEWYNDQQLYHLIGFLTSSKSGYTIPNLIKEYYTQKFKKSKFIAYITSLIQGYFANTDINDLSYDYTPDARYIRDILLLFNIVTVMKKSNAYSRFPFDSYNKNAWSLEHIHAQNTDNIGSSREIWFAWIDEHIASFREFSKPVYKEVIQKLESVDRDNLSRSQFDELFNEICGMIQDDFGIDLHSIDNMALLDIRNNSSISNNFFDVKRKMIIEKDRKGEFIPVCTRNVFLKYYSRDPSQIHYWSASDRDDYLNAIKTALAEYLPKEECSDEG